MDFNLELQTQEGVPPDVAQSKREEEARMIQAEAARDAQAMKAQEVTEIGQVEEEARRDAQLATTGEREEVRNEARRDALTEVAPLAPKAKVDFPLPFPVREGERAEPIAIRQPKSLQPPSEIRTIGPLTKPEKEYPTIKLQRQRVTEGGEWSKNPTVQKVSEILFSRPGHAPVAAAGHPIIAGLYEVYQQAKNFLIADYEAWETGRSDYNPLEQKTITGELYQGESEAIRLLLTTGEMGVDMLLAGLSAGAIKNSAVNGMLKNIFKRAVKTGKATQAEVNQLSKKLILKDDITAEKAVKGYVDTVLRKVPRTTKPTPKLPEPEVPAPKPTAPKLPETEVRVSTDVATGETVIKIPQQKVAPPKLAGEIKPEAPTVKPTDKEVLEKIVEKDVKEAPRLPEPTVEAPEKPVETRLAKEKPLVKPKPPVPSKPSKIEDRFTKIIKQEKELETVAEKPTAKPEDNPLIREAPPVKIPEVYTKALQQKTETADRMFTDVMENQATHKPREIKRRFKDLERDYTDEQQHHLEEVYADSVLSKATGDVSELLAKMKRAGVRPEIIESVKNARINDRFLLDSIKHFKREPKTGAISGVMVKGWKDWLSRQYLRSGGGEAGGIKKYTEGFFDDSAFGRLTRGLIVPQVAFKKMGLMPIYDSLRGGERAAGRLDRNLQPQVLSAYHGPPKKVGPVKTYPEALSLKERELITKYDMTQQGMLEDMRMAGWDGVEVSDLSPAAQKVVRWRRKYLDQQAPEIERVAKLVNEDIELIKDYSPLYTKKGIKEHKRVELPSVGKDNPGFKSIHERVPGVPVTDYELDSLKTLQAYTSGMARFTKVGEKSIPLRYVLDSPEFKEMVGPKDWDYADKWFDYSVSPPPTPKGWRFLRRAGYWSYLGLNPLSMAKQGISWVDAAVLEKWGGLKAKDFKKAIKKMELDSVGERKIEIGVADLTSKYDRVMLWGISKADQMFANNALTNMLAGRLQAKADAGETLNNKSLRTVLREASNDIDLLMMGATPAQRPEWFRGEVGKFALQFQSTITSRFNSYLERMSGAKDNKDFLLIAKILGTFMLGGYVESTIQNMRAKKLWEKEDIVEILKSTGGNISLLGTLMFSLERGEWTVAPFVQTVNDTLGAFKKLTERAGIKEIAGLGLTLGQIVGLPRQAKKTLDGLLVTEGKGKRVSRSKYIEVDKLDEKIRAWVKGQYGPKEVKEYFKDTKLKTRLHKRIAKIFATTSNKSLLSKLPEMTKKPFWGDDGRTFLNHARSLGSADYKTIQTLMKRAEKEDIELNPTSILYYIKDRLKE